MKIKNTKKFQRNFWHAINPMISEHFQCAKITGGNF